MIEQEMASIIKFILDNTEKSSPYYHNIPENFYVPATYFPVPEITSRGETFLTYALEYTWYVKFFDVDSQSAYFRAYQAINALQARRNVITLLDENGAEISAGLRLNDPSISVIDVGVAQIVLRWASRRPYAQSETSKMQTYDIEFWDKGAYKSPSLSAALEEAAGLLDKNLNEEDNNGRQDY